MIHYVADVPGVSSYVDAYGDTEKEARKYLRKVLGYSRLPKHTVLIEYDKTWIKYW